MPSTYQNSSKFLLQIDAVIQHNSCPGEVEAKELEVWGHRELEATLSCEILFQGNKQKKF